MAFTREEREDIMDIINDNMNFEGSQELNYDGSGDDMLCFGGKTGASFINEASAVNRQFQVSIINANAKDIKVVLTPGILWSAVASGLLAAAINSDDVPGSMQNIFKEIKSYGWLFDGKSFEKDVVYKDADFVQVQSLSHGKMVDFYEFISKNPTNLLGMRVSDNSDDSLQAAKSLEIVSESPFKRLTSHLINPNLNLNQNTQQKNVVLFQTPGVVLSNQTQIEYSIAPALAVGQPRIVNITFLCGATLNTSAALEKKTARAVSNFGKITSNIFKI